MTADVAATCRRRDGCAGDRASCPPRRNTYRLTPAERISFANLRPFFDASAVFRFWGQVARSRGLDPATVIGVPFQPDAFTALPWDHGRHWCWPMPLRCRRPASEIQADQDRQDIPDEDDRILPPGTRNRERKAGVPAAGGRRAPK